MSMKTSFVSSEASTERLALVATPKHRWRPSTPSTPRSETTTPRRARTPVSAVADRYLPYRSAENMDFSRFQVNNSTPSSKGILRSSVNIPSSCGGGGPEERSKCAMRDRLLALKGQTSANRVLTFSSPSKHTRTTAPSGEYSGDYWNTNSAATPTSFPVKKMLRKIPKSADKVLDAPNLINDFYLNLLDWSKQDMVCIALESAVYVFNSSLGDVHQLCELESSYITSLQWNRSGKYLAVGTSSADVQIWDVNCSKCVRKMKSHQSRVSSLSWRPKSVLLSSGSQSGKVHNYDPRVSDFHVQSLNAHKLDVCGLQWSSNGRFLASGGNDNIVNIWDSYNHDPWSAPKCSFKTHVAAVKALAWCPWRPSVFASGGGSADKSIQLWNAHSGESQGKVVADSQVSGLVWSSEHRELLSCHGNPSNSLCLWKWQSHDNEKPLHQLGAIQGHEGRILHVACSPDGQTVATAGADETLRFWKCFEKKQQQQQHHKSSGASSDFNISKYMR